MLQFLLYTVPAVCLSTSLILLISFLTYGIYNIYFHPLSSYPGPRSWAFSIFPAMFAVMKGRCPFIVAEMHQKYGNVVRIAPNELSYTNAEIWSDVYTHRAGRMEMPKNPKFRDPNTKEYGLFDNPTAAGHKRIRKSITGAFSEQALRAQEPQIIAYVDLLMEQLNKCMTEGPVDMSRWYALTTFDIMGDLTFGEDFAGLKTSTYHRWIEIVFSFNKSIAILSELRRLWPFNLFLLAALPPAKRREISKTRAWHASYAVDQLDKRIASSTSRIDIMSHAIPHLSKPGGISRVELEKTCEALVIAGSDTTANLLTGCTYHLLRNPSVFTRLTHEIRSAFRNTADITMQSVSRLPYLLPVLNEALRLHPPVPGHHARLVGQEGAVVAGKFVPAGTLVAFAHWAAYHSPLNFLAPSEFRPERWMGAAEFEGDNRAVFQPFSVGPRNCVGMNLAHAEARLVLTRLLYEFDLILEEGQEDWIDGQEARLLWTKKSLWVKLEKRGVNLTND